MKLSRCLMALLVLSSFVGSSTAEEVATRMSPELLWKLGRVGNAALSGDGTHVAYTVRRYELEENSGQSSLYVIDLRTNAERMLLQDWDSIGDVQFAKSPFGERIYFTGTPGIAEEEATQAWTVNPTDGGIVQLTDIEDGLANLKVSPTATHLAFTLDIKLDDEVTELHGDLPKADARIIDSLMFRHWNAWHDYKYSHLHVAPVDENGKAGEARDLMADMKVDCPVPPFGGAEQFDWSPDGQQMAYTAKIVDRWAESTDSDVYLIDITPDARPVSITDGRDGYDNDPVYSPDGNYLAFHSMQRAGFEADRNRIMIYDRHSREITEATADLDQTGSWSYLVGGQRVAGIQLGTPRHQPDIRVNREGGGLQTAYRRPFQLVAR